MRSPGFPTEPANTAHCHSRAVTNENEATKIATDMSGDYTTAIRCALDGRYPICRKLNGNKRYWDKHSESFRDFSAHLPHEPTIIAAALALRPRDLCDWEVVEAWSWVYRHALLLNVRVGAFEDFCAHVTPKRSRIIVLGNLRRSSHIPRLPRADTSMSFDVVNGNA